MIELQNIINKVNDIVKVTENINSKYSISKENRERLRKDTIELQKISAQLKELAEILDNGQLRIIAEEIEYLTKEREKLDSKKELSRTDHLTIRQDGFVEGYSDRGTQQANYELLKELSDELNTINISIESKKREQEVYEENLKAKLENIQIKENLKKEIETLGATLLPTIRISVLKELSTRNLTTVTTDNLDKVKSLKEVQVHNAKNWKQIKEQQNYLKMLLNLSGITIEEKEQLEQKIKEMDIQLKECLQLARTYSTINKKIEQLEQVSKNLSDKDTLESIKEEIEESNTKQDERERQIVHKKELLKKQHEIKEVITKLPLELRTNLGIKLEEYGLLIPELDNALLEEKNLSSNEKYFNIDIVKTELKNIQEKLANEQNELIKYRKIYNDLLIKEFNNQLDDELKKYKEKVKRYIDALPIRISKHDEEKKDIQKMIRNYNKANRLIDELIALTQNKKIDKKENTQEENYYFDEENDNEEFNEKDEKRLNIITGEDGQIIDKNSKMNNVSPQETKRELPSISSRILPEVQSKSNLEQQPESNPKQQPDKKTALLEDKETKKEQTSENNKKLTRKIKQRIIRILSGVAAAIIAVTSLSAITNKLKSNKAMREISIVNEIDNNENTNSAILQEKENSVEEVVEDTKQKDISVEEVVEDSQQKDISVEEIVEDNQQKDISVEEIVEDNQQKDISVEETIKDNNEGSMLIDITDRIDISDSVKSASDGIKPIKEDTLFKAFYESGIIQAKANDEYTAMHREGEGILQENIKWWLDSGKPFYFEQDDKTGAYAWKEIQQDGSRVTLGYSTAVQKDNYIKSLSESTNIAYDDLYSELTGENKTRRK